MQLRPRSRLAAGSDLTPEQLKARNTAIQAAWDDPLRRALMSALKTKEGSRASSRAAYNAYFREYRRKRHERHHP